jgi:hypothetical protein
VQAVEAANSLVTEAENSKATGQELEELTTKAAMAKSFQSDYAPQLKQDASTKKGAATALTKLQQAKRAAAVKKYKKATAHAKRAQTALVLAHAACTKTSKDAALAMTKLKKAGRVKTNADIAHRAVVVQRDLLVTAAGDTKSQLTAAGQRKAGKSAMDKLAMAEAIAVADYQAYQTMFPSSARPRK